MAGLFFGSTYGAALGLLAAVSATVLAAFGSRARGYRQFSDDVAQRVGGAPARRSVRAQLQKVNRAVSGQGNPVVQATKVAVLRLLPHAPFTITNYFLGFTRVSMCAIACGTAVGMAPWVAFYAMVGANARALVASGATLSAVVGDAISTGAARIPSLLTSTELTIVVLCAALLLLRPAAPAEKILESR